jgi:uncharacterized protein YggE
MNNNKILVILISALLVLSLITTGALLFGGASKQSNSSGQLVNTISVSSTGEVTVLPDVGYISLGIETKDADVKEAEEDNSKIMNSIMEALKEFDIADEDIKTVGYNIYPQYEEYNDEKPTAYAVYNTIEVTVKNLEDMSDIIDAAINAGANRTNSIRFDVLDREESYNEALKNAVENARGRAEVLADASGLKIVGVVTVNEGSSSSQYYYADTLSYAKAESADGGYSPSISSGDMEISASVSVTFEVVAK